MEKSADELLATPWWRATDADLLSALREAEELHRRAYATALAVLAEARTRGLTGGYDNTRLALHDAARISVTEAARREAHVELLARSPEARAAVEAGLLGADHLDVITKTLAAIPSHVDPDQRTQAEFLLVEHARTLDARALKRAARHVLAWLDQDGPEPADEPVEQPANTLYLDTLHTGHVRIAGKLGPEAGALLTSLLDPLTAPRATDGAPDHRSRAERHGDALADLLRLTANAAATPIDGGQRPHLTLTMSLNDLRDQIGNAHIAGATDLGTLNARQARRIACDATVVPLVLDSASQPLDVGRAKRTAPPGIRRALVWRDGGCAFPACDRSAPWSNTSFVTSEYEQKIGQCA